mmetsp:Transcript_35211/g.101300  ORF Transcript_35211/g.101300 Transcript_35211/m.101300 type:complete len:83 (-) Transcript_35211:332-580(-)
MQTDRQDMMGTGTAAFTRITAHRITHMNQSTDRSIGLEDLKIARSFHWMEWAALPAVPPSLPPQSVSRSVMTHTCTCTRTFR